MVLIKFDPVLNALREKDGGATDLSGLAGSYAVSGNYVNKGGDTMTGSLTISMNDPEVRLIDSGDSEYTRWTRSDTNKEMLLLNRVNKPAGAGYGLNFDGTGDFVTMSDNSNYDMAGDFSVSCWFKTSGNGALLSHFDPAAPPYAGWEIGLGNVVASGKIYFYLGEYDGSAFITYAGANTYNDGNWHNVVITVVGTTVNFYVDTTDLGAVTKTGVKNGSSTNNLYLGRDSNTAPTRYFTGVIDDPQIFTKALSSGERSTIYNSGTGTYADLTIAPWSTNLVGLWRLDENTGTNAGDDSTINNDGTITAATWTTGKVPTASTITESQIISSQNGVSANEEGINTFGDSLGRTVFQGNTIWSNPTSLMGISGNVLATGSIATPIAGTNNYWSFGTLSGTALVALVTTQYVNAIINGSAVKLAVVS